MAHFRPLASSSTQVERNLIASPSPTHAISMLLVCMERFVAPVAFVFVLMLVLTLLWMARLMLRAVSGVRFEFMPRIFGVLASQSYINFSGKLL